MVHRSEGKEITEKTITREKGRKGWRMSQQISKFSGRLNETLFFFNIKRRL